MYLNKLIHHGMRFRACFQSDRIRCLNHFTNIETVDTAFSVHDAYQDITKPPLVVLHALMGSKYHWESMSMAINKATGRKVIAVDARNHGDSPHSPEITYIHMAHDLKRLMEKLELPRVSVLGHSMGGRTAMAFSLLFPELVSSLAVVEVTPIKTPLSLPFIHSLLDAMASISFESSVLTSDARELANERLKTVTPNEKIRNYLILNLINSHTSTQTWKVNIPALRKNFEEHLYKFPTSLLRLQYSGPMTFIAGALSNHVE
ncbi:unnamed protein product [Leptidea sinapis]|uniref:sn-1-specific diacylglycerol lipase ABHD11 n=1 Tax=Leptidea sinapis TaxID=189913 RepID=A0A5E4Q5J0_9NEOP|nr:unnamed protein product [Leptidea sinapis]